MSSEPEHDKNAPLRHADVHATLTRELADGRFPVGSRFPNEEELQKRFQVGRHTVREALKKLADQGYIDRRRKSGTVVLSNEPAVRYIQLLGTISNLFDFGTHTELKVRSFGFVRLRDPHLCELLKLPPDERWLRIAGVRMQPDNPAPLCWSEYYLPPCYAISREDLDRLVGPIYAQVLKRHGLQLDHVDQEIGSTALRANASALLQVPRGSPALTEVRRYFEGAGALMEATINLYPAGRYVVRSRIERQSDIKSAQ
ncbi:UTRA domain protein [Paraburkholderia xenovorans LB400]|uniref:Transcriptional regulator, GntR family n=1 Tax=Paraburkholderia xenovorans (strain LB400) TaxID=266265 RepID=Q13GS2_PARXL|nr:GntR family transcriptional regulator [Paraburkholderia xenovorans]ABE36717.1 transcriptional regulator, GntR family [Paraburkholderia xenovorans LB400]AIP33891.1 UTRA domain protein [Paraburkholderia xenovorans LB400]